MRIFSEVLNISEKSISLPGNRDDYETWDSIAHLQLIMMLETEFNIRLTTEQVTQIDSVQKSIELVKSLTDR